MAGVHSSLLGEANMEIPDEASDQKLEWTGRMLRDFQVGFLGGHCTGIEAVYRRRALTGLKRQTCSAGAVGATFPLMDGLSPGRIAK